ncbi:substrate-binding domain-containing protein [Anaerosacchariphilus polymeriproducens]|uniref:LacI family transcriptional regulator n=1 Tax=Anaerosacchariphilus polymeriproducens TaxID=1812858 RepID=A0A371B0D4_9FIRM|nr:substrate-binding domain-containing protein [Anaerosacchariphilus polymeriproducens]RDU25256.1 LacI family transcriptional regulator [Anaerosacchariphilus polymeriproducens]
MKKKLFSIMLVITLIGTMLMGCGSNKNQSKDQTVDSTAKKSLKIGFAQKTLENEFQKALAEGLKSAATKEGFEVTVLDAKNDIANEQTNMETFISQKYDLIFINVVDTEAATASIEAAVDAGIPVIGIDSHVSDDAPVVTNISAPDRENGRVVGLYAVTQYAKDQLISAAILSGNKGNPGGQDRRVGEFCGILEGRLGCTEEEAWKLAEKFEQELTDNGKAKNEKANFEVVAQGWGNWTTDEGLPAMEDILVANPNINCLLGENDSMLIGGQKAIEDVGKSDQIQIFAAADAMKEALELIKKGTNYKASGLNNPKLVAEKGIEVAKEILKDGKATDSFGKKVTTDPICVEKGNIDKYYDPNSLF